MTAAIVPTSQMLGLVLALSRYVDGTVYAPR